MLKYFKLAVIMCVLFAVVGCGPRVEVPTAHVGKRSTTSGLQEGIIQPSKFRLQFQWPGTTGDSLILVEAADYPAIEKMQIFMPKDELNISLEVRGTFAISSNDQNVNKVFARISPQKIADRISKIGMQKVYGTYAQPVIRETTRSIITNYSIQEVMSNREAIGQELAVAIKERLKNTPITTIYFGLADVQPPEVIVIAQESAKKREIAIKEAENEKMVSLKKAEAAYEVAIKQQQVDLKEAETHVLVNKKLTEGVNEAFVTQRALKVLNALAENNNTVFFMPMEAMKNPTMILGAMNRENIKGKNR
jgi:hypothetical protein